MVDLFIWHTRVDKKLSSQVSDFIIVHVAVLEVEKHRAVFLGRLNCSFFAGITGSTLKVTDMVLVDISLYPGGVTLDFVVLTTN